MFVPLINNTSIFVALNAYESQKSPNNSSLMSEEDIYYFEMNKKY